MKQPVRISVAVTVIVLAFLVQGCVPNSGEKPTGLRYIFEEARKAGMGYGSETGIPDSGPEPMESEKQPGEKPDTEKGKKVYLTFDDGPDAIVTPLILDVLDSYGIKATFFVVGTNIEKNPEVLRDIVERGHALGNHTYSHRYNEIYSNDDSFLKSIKTNEELIVRLAGVRPKVVRDPGGELGKNSPAAGKLEENGYRLTGWNVESYDSRSPHLSAPEIIEHIGNQAKNRILWPEMVIVMHDGPGHLHTVRALPTVIELLRSRGFQFDVLK